MQSPNEDMYPICHTKEKEARKENKKRHKTPEKTLQGDGLWREQTHGTTGSGNCSQDMKRR